MDIYELNSDDLYLRIPLQFFAEGGEEFDSLADVVRVVFGEFALRVLPDNVVDCCFGVGFEETEWS